MLWRLSVEARLGGLPVPWLGGLSRGGLPVPWLPWLSIAGRRGATLSIVAGVCYTLALVCRLHLSK